MVRISQGCCRNKQVSISGASKIMSGMQSCAVYFSCCCYCFHGCSCVCNPHSLFMGIPNKAVLSFFKPTLTRTYFFSFYNLSEYQVLFLTLYFQHYRRKLSYLLYLVLLPNYNIYGK